MKRICIYLIFFLLHQSVKAQRTEIYSIKIDSIQGDHSIDFKAFKNRRLLIVTSASLDTNFSQLFELKKLREKKNEGLVVVVVPTNDFGNEPADNSQIASLFNELQLPFILCSKTVVLGDNSHPLFKWLTQKQLNGVLDTRITGPFHKFLINANGKLEAVFSPTVRLRKAISLQDKTERKNN